MQNNTIPPCFYRISVKSLILDKNWKFLLCKERSGIWDLPWGGLDEWENIRNWIIREIREEMWLDIARLEDQPSYFLKFIGKDGKEKVNVVYQTQVTNLHFIPSDECLEVWFFSKEDIDNIEVFPNVQEFIKIYKPEKHVHL